MTREANREAALATFQRATSRHIAHLERLREAHARTQSLLGRTAPAPREERDELTFDPETEPWIQDHRPTHGVAVIPAAWLFDRMAQSVAARGHRVVGLDDARLMGFVIVDEPRRMQVVMRWDAPHQVAVTLLVYRESVRAGLSRFEPRASAIVRVDEPEGDPHLADLEALVRPTPLPDAYDNVFLGPSFRITSGHIVGDNGATCFVNPHRSALPPGHFHVGLLDASLHAGVPRVRLRWYPGLDFVCLPNAITWLRRYAPFDPGRVVRIELRTRGHSPDQRFGFAHVRYYYDERLVLALDSTQVLFPSRVPPDRTDRFMRDRLPCPGVSTARHDGETTRFGPGELARLDWLPGTLARVYAHDPTAPIESRALDVALKDHGALRLGLHPHDVLVDAARGRVMSKDGRSLEVDIERVGHDVVVRDRRPPP